MMEIFVHGFIGSHLSADKITRLADRSCRGDWLTTYLPSAGEATKKSYHWAGLKTVIDFEWNERLNDSKKKLSYFVGINISWFCCHKRRNDTQKKNERQQKIIGPEFPHWYIPFWHFLVPSKFFNTVKSQREHIHLTQMQVCQNSVDSLCQACFEEETSAQWSRARAVCPSFFFRTLTCINSHLF